MKNVVGLLCKVRGAARQEGSGTGYRLNEVVFLENKENLRSRWAPWPPLSSFLLYPLSPLWSYGKTRRHLRSQESVWCLICARSTQRILGGGPWNVGWRVVGERRSRRKSGTTLCCTGGFIRVYLRLHRAVVGVIYCRLCSGRLTESTMCNVVVSRSVSFSSCLQRISPCMTEISILWQCESVLVGAAI